MGGGRRVWYSVPPSGISVLHHVVFCFTVSSPFFCYRTATTIDSIANYSARGYTQT